MRVDYVMRSPPDRSVLSLLWSTPTLSKQSVSLCHLYDEPPPEAALPARYRATVTWVPWVTPVIGVTPDPDA